MSITDQPTDHASSPPAHPITTAVLDVARSAALVGSGVTVATSLGTAAIALLIAGDTFDDTESLVEALHLTWLPLMSGLTMLAALLAYATHRRRLTAVSVTLVALVQVVAITLGGLAGAVSAVLPLTAAAALGMLVIRPLGHPRSPEQRQEQGLWWRALVFLALPAGVAAAVVWLAGSRLPVLSSDLAYPLLPVLAAVFVADIIYMLTLGKTLRQRVHLITAVVILLAQLPIGLWNIVLERDAGWSPHDGGPAGAALIALTILLLVTLSRRPR